MQNYKTIHTLYGLQLMAQAEASGIPINLTEVAVGDGNGNPVIPSEGQTMLARELYRAQINRVYQDPVLTTKFTVEMIIPATEGGFTIREIGVYDADGGLFVIGNVPDTYKPQASEGAFSDTIIRVEFLVTNASVVTIQVDPNVAVASQAWVLNNINACQIIPGGTTGQVLRKATNACGDTEWVDPTDANVVVDIIEEEQTLADLQTTVIWSLVTTNGLAVYIEGVRLTRGPGVDQWEADPLAPDTQIILGKSYPGGTRITGVQNDPLGDVPFPLARDQNLADVENAATARTNLDVFNKAETRQMAPSGLVAYFARNTAPSGWLKANGAAISRTAYADLFAAIGTTFGVGDGFNTFNLPDLRGEFIRGWDDGRNIDAGRAFGSFQADELKSHSHRLKAANYNISINNVPGRVLRPDFAISAESLMENTGGSETRPRNRSLLVCIKF